MDAPPHFRHVPRYGSVFQPHRFMIIPHDLPPPPPPPPHIHLPPPPPPPLLPPRHDSHLLFHSGFPFSPPHHHILDRSHDFEFGPPNKLHLNRFLPPPTTLPQNANLPVSISHDYPHPNPRLEDGILLGGINNRFIHDPSGSWNEDLRWGLREYNSRVSDIEQDDRCNSSWVSKLEGRDLFRKRNYEAMRWGYGIHGSRELSFDRDCDARRWEYDIDRDCDSIIKRETDERRRGYDVETLSLQLDNNGKELLEGNSRLGRYSGRFGRECSEREFSRSKKMKRVQKKSALHRIQLGKSCRGINRSHDISENRNMCDFRLKEKKDLKCMETTMKDKRVKEQSPVALSISFKSNSLVAKAVLVPSSPTIKEGMNLSPRNIRMGKINLIADSLLTNSTKDLVGTEYMLDSKSDLQSARIELPEKFNVSGNGNAIAHNTYDFGVNYVENAPARVLCLQGLSDVVSGRRPTHRLRKKRRGKNQVLIGTNLQMTRDSYEFVSSNTTTAGPSYVPQLKTNCTLSKVNASSAVLLPSLGSVVSAKGGIDSDNDEPSILNSKRKKNSLEIFSPLHVVDDASTEFLGHSGREVSANKDNYCASDLGSGKVTVSPGGSFLANENTGHGDNFGFSHDADSIDICIHNRDSILTTVMNLMEPNNLSSNLRTDVVDNINQQSLCDENSLLENSCNEGPSEFPIAVEGGDIAGLLRPPQTRISEVQEDKHVPEYHESYVASVSDSALLNKIDNVVSDLRSADTNLKEIFPNQVIIPEVDKDETRILEGAAVAYHSNVSLGAVCSDFLPEDHKVIVSEEAGKFSNKSISTRRSPGAINHEKTYSCIDYSLKTKSKRKTRVARMGISASNIKMLSDMGSSVDAQFENYLLKDPSSVEKDDCLGEIDNCELDFRLKEGPSGDEDSPEDDVDISAMGSFCGHRKKRKVISSRLTLSHPSEDDLIGDFLTGNGLKLDQVSRRPPEWRDDGREGAPSATYIEISDGEENFSVKDVDDILADCNNSNVRDDISFYPNTLSVLADGSSICDTKSDDALYGSDTPSCVSSPEDLLLYSDFSFPRDINSSPRHAENAMIFGKCEASSAMPVSVISNSSLLVKSIENATFDHTQINAKVSPSLPQNMGKVVQKFSLVCGQLSSSKRPPTPSVPKVFPANHALLFNTSKRFPATHGTKSRTWHRTCTSSVPVAGPISKSRSLPHSHETKTLDFQNSYIRQGNSLVRKPSSSGISSKSSVYQLSPCTGNIKEGQTFDIKADAPSVPGIRQLNTSERPEVPSLNHIGKSSSSASGHLGKSLAVANSLKKDCSINTLDTSEKTAISSAILNSDSQCALGKGNSGKKITYVKRRSNQLVAASDPDDSSTSGQDKSQTSFSDGYYKKRKNQLVRVPSESHVKEGDGTVNINSNKLKFPRSSSKKQSSKGFNKAYKSSKFSTVWTLNDDQLSNKDIRTLGPKKLSPYLFPWKRSTYRRTSIPSLGSRPNDSSSISQRLMLSSKRGAIYTRSTHGYSLRISKVLSVGGSSLKWSKSIERSSKKANQEATRAVAAAEKRKKEEKSAISIVSKSRNHVSRERIFRVGSERYKMDPTRRTLHRITAKEEPSPSCTLQSEKNSKRSYVPRRLLIGNDEYVRIGNGNQLVRDPKRRTRVLASEKVRWSLRTARLRLARKRKYCQFFTRFGKCNKNDGKCPYIHDNSKIVVCTKFLNGSCPDPDCKLTHKVIPERMSDCSYFLKGSCSNEKCPYRHGNVNPNSSICKKFLRGYCPDGNECRMKHTYVCPAFESTGICPQGSTCKLHHPKKKSEKEPASEQKNVKGRYFDGGLIDIADYTGEGHSVKGKDDTVCEEGKYPDYISLDFSDEEVE